MIREGIDPKKTFFPDEEDDWLKVSPPHLASPYGLLRSPWNFNPSKYTTRYNNVNRIANTDDSIDNTKWGLYLGSTCKDYASFITHVKSQELPVYLAGAEDDVHGNIHFAFGGSGGDHCAATDDILRADYKLTDLDLINIARSSQIFLKSNVYPLSTKVISPLSFS